MNKPDIKDYVKPDLIYLVMGIVSLLHLNFIWFLIYKEFPQFHLHTFNLVILANQFFRIVIIVWALEKIFLYTLYITRYLRYKKYESSNIRKN